MLLAGAVFATMVLATLRVEYDTGVMLDGVDGVLHCFATGRWIGCPYAWQWPLAGLQFLPSVVLRAAGVRLGEIGRLWAGVSLVGYLGILVLSYRVLAPRSRPAAVAAVLVLG